jgi:hypothetical protein
MCGGCSIFIADASAMLPCDIRNLTKFGGDWGQEVGGAHANELENEDYDGGYDDYYIEETVIKGPLGQIIVIFSPASSDAIREEALLYLRGMLESMVDRAHGMQTADYTEVRWLSKDVVGLFTSYEYGDWTEEDGSGFNNSDLDQVKYPFTFYYDTGEATASYMKIRKKVTASDQCSVFADVQTRLSLDSLGTKVRTLFSKYSGLYALPTMLSELVDGKTVILTDNCIGQSCSQSGAVTLDFINWLLEFGPELRSIIRKYLLSTGLYGNEISAEDVGKYIKVTQFPIAHNPNESGHEIIGCGIYLDGCGMINPSAEDHKALDGEVWNYG